MSAQRTTESVAMTSAVAGFDLARVRRDFPLLSQRLADGRPLVYLDTAATAQKPQCVIDKVVECYREYNANVHRGVHPLHERVTQELENARRKLARFIGAREFDEYDDLSEVIFTSGATMSINLVAHGWGRKFLRPGDEILLNLMEHHANLVPWQQAAQATGAVLKFIPLTPDGQLDLARLDDVLTHRTKLVAVTGMSNVLGTLPPVAELAQRAHGVGALILVDGAQSVPHLPVNVRELDIDFLAFSGHKLYGPTGVGVLWGRLELLDAMNPFLTGGNMIDEVFAERSTFKRPPFRFEAGTLPIAEAIGLGAAVDYLAQLGFEAVAQQEHQLLVRCHERLEEIAGVRIIGPAPSAKGAIVSFTVEGVPAHDMGTFLAMHGVAVRASHHCTMPLHAWLNVDATTRASFAFYNTLEEVDALADAIRAAQRKFCRGTRSASRWA
jgi:cysteine desulfurase/selenocysteine lyase